MSETTLKNSDDRAEESAKSNREYFVQTFQGKRVVVDTSSLLISGTRLLADMPECELVIPSVVLIELEEKRTHPTLGFLARQWLRLIDSLRRSEEGSLRRGIVVPEHPHVVLRVEANHTSQKCLPPHLRDGSTDKTILAVAMNFKEEGEEGGSTEHVAQSVALLSNDTPMKLYADLDLGIPSAGYDHSSIEKVEPFDGMFTVELTKDELSSIYEGIDQKGSLEYGVFPGEVHRRLVEETVNVENCAIALVFEGSPCFYAVKNSASEFFVLREDISAQGISGRTIQQQVALRYLKSSVSEIPVVSLGGSAGTGKTLLALAAGISGVNAGEYDKVIVFRSLHEMGQGQELGFLPGDAQDKMRPWAGAVYDALSAISKNSRKRTQKFSGGSQHVHSASNDEKQFNDIVEVSPITYLRGRSLVSSYIVIEEAQNFSFSELLNILSRVGDKSKVVLTFDAAQVDNKFLSSGNNADVWSVVDKLKGSDVFAHITLKKTERSRVAEIASRTLESNK